MAVRPANPGGGRRQHRVGSETLLLDSRAEGCPDGVGGGDQGEDPHGCREVSSGDPGLTSQLLKDLGELWTVREETTDTVGNTPVYRTEEGQSEAPAKQGWPMESPSEPQRRSQSSRGRSGAQSGLDYPGADIPASRQPKGARGRQQRQPGREQQYGPPFLGVSPELGEPTDGGQPRHPPQTAFGATVTGQAEHEGSTNHSDGDSPGGPGPLGQLGCNSGQPGEDDGDRGVSHAKGNRPRCRQTEADQPGGAQSSQYQAGRCGHDEAGSQRRVAPHHRCPQQLASPGLLFLPGVSDHGQCRHDPDQDRPDDSHPPGGEVADRRAIYRAEKGDD